MDRLRIVGGIALKGDIVLSGAKNAALPLMTACLLTDSPLTLGNIPDLADIVTMQNVLSELGVDINEKQDHNPSRFSQKKLVLNAGTVQKTVASYEWVSKMRASILVLGPLLARFGRASVSLPGGCAIGARPIDLHLKALQQMGAVIELVDGYVHAQAPQGMKGRLHGATITFPFVSVGATENILMAACLAEGQTVLMNAATEPEITDLAHCLVRMGAKIKGIGTDTLSVEGVLELRAAEHDIISDRIELATYAMMAAATDGEIVLYNVGEGLQHSVMEVLEQAGVQIDAQPNTSKAGQGLRVRRKNAHLNGVDVTTEPYPGFPTDLQAQLMGLLTIATGASSITETIFENRFMHVPELQRMGANICLRGNTALIRGVEQLMGAQIMATDLRASVSLVIAALVAKGESVLSRLYHLDRGYEAIEKKLQGCGANISRI